MTDTSPRIVGRTPRSERDPLVPPLCTPTRALIVGASGQVGRQLVIALGGEHSLPASRRPAPGWLTFDLATLSPSTAAAILRPLELNAVYCVGGMTDVERCEREPELAMRANCHGPAALAAAAAARELPFVYFSTEYVFDGVAGPYAEDAPARPISVYGRSKWEGEVAVQKAHPGALIVRTTVVYGYDPGGRNFLYSLSRAMLAGQEFRVASDQVSTPTYNRDLAHVALSLVAARASGVFHACGPERLSRLELARRAAVVMGMDPDGIVGLPTRELGQRAPRPLDAGLATDKLRRLYPALRMRGLEESLQDWMAA